MSGSSIAGTQRDSLASSDLLWRMSCHSYFLFASSYTRSRSNFEFIYVSRYWSIRSDGGEPGPPRLSIVAFTSIGLGLMPIYNALAFDLKRQCVDPATFLFLLSGRWWVTWGTIESRCCLWHLGHRPAPRPCDTLRRHRSACKRTSYYLTLTLTLT